MRHRSPLVGSAATNSLDELSVRLAPQFRLTSEKLGDTQPQRDAGVNLAGEYPLTARRSDYITPQIVTISASLAAEGAAVAGGMAETARIRREQRRRDLIASIAEWERASGPDRAWWRQDALHRLQEWRRLYRQPQRAAFTAAVATAQHRRAAA